jgi:hypothetical protein
LKFRILKLKKGKECTELENKEVKTEEEEALSANAEREGMRIEWQMSHLSCSNLGHTF